MTPITFDNLSYLHNGQRKFLISGEIHYFRVPHDSWRDRLEKFKAVGGNCVATYVPWLLHEPEEGVFNFTDPQLDFDRFLTLCRELELSAIVRPGPYQYSELAYDGLPGWLCENYPEVRARHIDGKDFRASSISYLHPTFLEKTHRWYSEVIPRLAKHQASAGGAVTFAQVDNELMGIHEWFGSWDYNRDAMGVGRETGRWPDFLRTRYGSLAAVNDAFGTTATTWSAIMPIDNTTATVTGDLVKQQRLIKDYQECYFTAIAEYVATLAQWMHEGGLTVPIVHNSGNPSMNGYFLETTKRMGKSFLLGSDHYYNLGMDWSQNNPTPQYASQMFTSLEMLRHLSVPPTVFELPGGSLADFPPITAHDALACYLTNLAYGMKGLNYYIFAGGYNPTGAGVTGEVYDYGAAISPTGEIRELYGAQKAVGDLLSGHTWLAGATRQADCRIGFNWEYSRSRHYGNQPLDGVLSNTDAYQFARTGLMMTANSASLSPTTVDLSSDDFLNDTQTPLMIATSASLARDIQERLVRFLEIGGKLLIAPVIPTLDENFSPCTVLADYLGGVQQQPMEKKAPQLTAFGVRNVFVNKALYATTHRPAAAVTTAIEERTGSEIGWRYTLPTGGVVSVLGLHWQLSKCEHEHMLRKALEELGIDPIVRCDNPNVWTSLHSDGTHALIYLLNLFTAPMTTTVSYRDPASGNWVDLGRQTIPGITVQAWSAGKQVL